MRFAAVADIGTCSTKVVTGRKEGAVTSVAGVGKSESRGVKGGKVVKPKQAGKSLKEATKRAEEMASENIGSISIGVGGDVLNFSENRATVTINSEDGLIRQKDVDRLQDLVSSVDVGLNREIISTIPLGFSIDGQPGVTNPVGLQGRRLDIVATLVSVERKWIKNFAKVASLAGLDLAGLLPIPHCTGSVLLTEEERTRGKTVIDFGQETTDLLVFKEGKLADHLSFSLGGKNLTGDLAARLSIPREEARSIKYEFDISAPGDDSSDFNRFGASGRNNQNSGRTVVCSTLSARLEEIFDLVLEEARQNGYDKVLALGVVITGGGARQPGLIEFLNDTLEPYFEIGKPIKRMSGIKDVVEDPSYSPVLGLLNCALDDEIAPEGKSSDSSGKSKLISRIRQRIKNILPGDSDIN